MNLSKIHTIPDILIPTGKKIYFASDFHLGAPDAGSSLKRERLVTRWLEEISGDASHIFLVGDVFDFWFEYRRVVPKGFTRLLGKLAELRDRGIGISLFTGNHDMWVDGYFEQELDIPVYQDPVRLLAGPSKILLGHGDGLGPGDRKYKMMKGIFRNPLCRGVFSGLHPSWGIGLAHYLSRKSRETTETETFLGTEREWLVQFSLKTLKEEFFDYFVFGHRHLALDISLPGGSRYINLGDWIRFNSYCMLDATGTMELAYYKPAGS